MKNKLEIDYKNNRIIKAFSSRIAFDRELSVYSVLKSTQYIPQVIAVNDLSITMERVEGDTFAKIAEEYSYNQLLIAFTRLVDCLYDFEQIYISKTGKNILLCDFNPRNFILCEKRVVFVDFEDSADSEGYNWAYLLSMVDNCKFSDLSIKDMLYSEIVNAISKKYNLNNEFVENTAKEYINFAKERRAFYKITANIDCMLIAGGKSRRMNGVPKGLLKLGRYSFCDYLIYSAQCFDNVYISANLSEYNKFNIPVMKDTHSDIGPISAIYSALTTSKNDWVFLIPCDMPFVSEKIIKYAVKQCDFTKEIIVFCAQNREYPTLSFYNKKILPKVCQKIAENDYKLKNLLESTDCQYINIPFENQMMNVNTPEDLKKAIEYYEKESL